jgi:hypothetical protein
MLWAVKPEYSIRISSEDPTGWYKVKGFTRALLFLTATNRRQRPPLETGLCFFQTCDDEGV